MTSFNKLFDPQGIGAAEEEATAYKTLLKNNQMLQRFINKTSAAGMTEEDVMGTALEYAKHLHSDKKGEEFDNIVLRMYEKGIEQKLHREPKAAKEALKETVKRNILISPLSAIGSPPQVEAIKKHEGYRLEDPQVHSMVVKKYTDKFPDFVDRLIRREYMDASNKENLEQRAMEMAISAGGPIKANDEKVLELYEKFLESLNKEDPLVLADREYKELSEKDYYGPIREETGPIITTLLTGSRGAQAAVGKTAEEIGNVEKKERSLPSKILGGAAMLAAPLVPVAAPYLVGATAPGALTTATGVIKSLLTGEKTVFGTEVSDAAELLTDPVELARIGKEAYKTGFKAAFSAEGEYDLAIELRKIKEKMATRAAMKAIDELGPDADVGLISNRAREIQEELIKEDTFSLALEHPRAAQFTVEMLAPDPAGRAIGKGLKHGYKAVKEIPGVNIPVNIAADILNKKFTFKDFTKKITGIGPEAEIAASKARMSHSISKYEMDKHEELLTKKLMEIDWKVKSIEKGLSRAERKELRRYWTIGIEDPYFMPPKKFERVKELIPYGKEMRDLFLDVHEQVGTLNKWSKHRKVAPVLKQETREHWIPHRKYQEDIDDKITAFKDLFKKQSKKFEEVPVVDDPYGRYQKSLQARGAHARTKNKPIIMDPMVQWKAELEDVLPKAREALHLEDVVKSLKEGNVIHTFKRPNLVVHKKKANNFRSVSKKATKKAENYNKSFLSTTRQARSVRERLDALTEQKYVTGEKAYTRAEERIVEINREIKKLEDVIEIERKEVGSTWMGGRDYRSLQVLKKERKKALKELEEIGSEMNLIQSGDKVNVSKRAGELIERHSNLTEKSEFLFAKYTEQMYRRQLANTSSALHDFQHLTNLNYRNALDDHILELSNKTGVPHADIPLRIENVINRLMGDVGVTRMGESISIAPVPVIEYFKRTHPIKQMMPEDYDLKVMHEFIEGIWKPHNTFWRNNVTIGAALPFAAVNASSSFGISTITLGAKTFNPFFQVKTIAASLLSASGYHEAAMKMAKNIKFTLRSGYKTNLAEVIDNAKKIGAVGQLEHLTGRVGSERLAHKLVLRPQQMLFEHKVPGLERIPKIGGPLQGLLHHISPSYISRASENYQHLLAFMGMADDFSRVGLSRAADKVAKYSGDYSRMTDFEKKYLTNGVAFYGWLRTALGLMVRSAHENPSRIARWLKLQGGLESFMAPNVPMNEEGYSMWASHARAIPGAALAQPHNYFNNLGSHQYVVQIIANPALIAVPFIPFLSPVKGEIYKGGKATALLVPGINAAISLLSGIHSVTGKPIDTPISFENIFSSYAGEYANELIKRPSQGWYNCWKAWSGRPEQITMQTMLACGKWTLGMDNWAARAFGFEPPSVGGMLDPLTGGFPGSQNYLQKPISESARRSDWASSPLWRIFGAHKRKNFSE